jgi:SAM-dependent methyltransferase
MGNRLGPSPAAGCAPPAPPSWSSRLGIIARRTLITTGYERTMPPLVLAAVRPRRDALASRARGRVLDLGGSGEHASIAWPDAVDEVVTDPDSTGRFDTVLSIFQLASAADLAAKIAQVRDQLAPDGRLLFLEPVRRPGLIGRLQHIASPTLRRAGGWRVDRDIPDALRDGFTVLDLERFTMPTLLWYLRAAVQGAARPKLGPTP